MLWFQATLGLAGTVLIWVGIWDLLTMSSKLNHLRVNVYHHDSWSTLQETWTYLILGWLLSVWADNVCIQVRGYHNHVRLL